jgi:hypothetical protein
MSALWCILGSQERDISMGFLVFDLWWCSLFPRCPVIGTAAGVKTWPGEAISDLWPHLHCLWILFNQLWCELDSDPDSKKRPGMDGGHMDCAWTDHNGGSIPYNSEHTSWLTISRDTTKSQVSLIVSVLTFEDTAIYNCARNPVTLWWDFRVNQH